MRTIGSVPLPRARHAAAMLASACLVGCAQIGAPGTPESVGMSSERLARVGAAFKEEAAQSRLPGSVVMVARRGQVVYQDVAGFQNRATGTPMSADSIFRIYSMTKPLVSVAAMMLVEDGRIQLADPVSKFLPGFDKLTVSVASADAKTFTSVPQARQMTVQDLLRHTSGLAYGELTRNQPVRDAYAQAGAYLGAVRDFDSRAASPQVQVAGLAKAPLAQHPGTTWEYSLSSDVLGRVVEAASGQRLGDFLEARLFKPLGMKDTAFWVPPGKTARVAEPFATDPATGTPNKLIDVSARPGNDSGGAGGVSTAADYMRFCLMLANGGQLDGVRILSRSTIDLMTSDHLGGFIAQPLQPGELLIGSKGYGFGLGFAVRQAAGVAAVPGAAGQYMWAGYAGTYFWVDPKEQLVAVMMTQAPSPARAYYRRMLQQLVYQAIEN